MTEDELKELLRLTRENNEMLKEVTAYVRRISSESYVNAEYEREFAFNVVADIFVEIMQDSMRNGLREPMKNIFSRK